MTSGSIILPNGTTTFIVSTSTPLTSLVNYAPTASFTFSTSSLVVTITDTSSDPNNSSLPDSWTYNWDFGDTTTATGTFATTSNSQIHAYTIPGTYTIILNMIDQYGLSSTATSSITVAGAPDTTAPVITLLGSTPVTLVVGTTTYTDAGATATDNIDGNITGSIVTV
ncbi:DUF5011 domain-containing protein, partial [Candidatus Gracilibacteria bacterium]|nr:DUF5011 domain-containing protein [Candidatus Gracilibacteria bacterium]